MLILFAVAALSLTVVTLPLVLELAIVTYAFVFMPKGRQGYPGPDLRLTVVIPAHNEEDSIGDCVGSVLGSAGEDTVVLVVAHNCVDNTGKVALDAGATVVTFNDMGAYGKGHALRCGFDRAIAGGAEAVLVIDADSVVTRNLIPEVLHTLRNGAQAVQCRYEMVSLDESPKGRLTALAFRAFTFIRGAGRNRMGLSAGISGNGFALRAELLKQVPYDAFSIVEDLEYHIRIVMAGERVTFIDDAIVFSCLPSSAVGSATQSSRWQGGRMLVAGSWLPALLRKLLCGEFRLFEPMLDLAGLPIAFGVAALLLECVIPIYWAQLYALGAIAIIAIHLTVAARVGGNPLELFSLLLYVPTYMLSKVRLLPRIFESSSSRAAWIRTDRQK